MKISQRGIDVDEAIKAVKENKNIKVFTCKWENKRNGKVFENKLYHNDNSNLPVYFDGKRLSIIESVVKRMIKTANRLHKNAELSYY